jgi:hypothetical protein
MPAPVLTTASKLMCPHGGQVTIVSTSTITIQGAQVATIADQFLIAGCAFTVPPGKPQPCVRIQWMSGAVKLTIGGVPAVLATSPGICMSVDQIPGGPPIVMFTQPVVVAD